MKVISLVFISLLFYLLPVAQVITNIYWTEQTEMDKSNTIYYNPTKNLIWDNFKGVPGPPGPVAAITASGFGYKANMNSSGGKGEINIAVYCYFNKKGSWVKPGKTTTYILNHEQHHFDIVYLFAMQFIHDLKTTKYTMANYGKVIEKMYRKSQSALLSMQIDYDAETKNSQLPDEQQLWNKKIDEQVLAISKQ